MQLSSTFNNYIFDLAPDWLWLDCWLRRQTCDNRPATAPYTTKKRVFENVWSATMKNTLDYIFKTANTTRQIRNTTPLSSSKDESKCRTRLTWCDGKTTGRKLMLNDSISLWPLPWSHPRIFARIPHIKYMQKCEGKLFELPNTGEVNFACNGCSSIYAHLPSFQENPNDVRRRINNVPNSRLNFVHTPSENPPGLWGRQKNCARSNWLLLDETAPEQFKTRMPTYIARDSPWSQLNGS